MESDEMSLCFESIYPEDRQMHSAQSDTIRATSLHNEHRLVSQLSFYHARFRFR